MGKFRCARPEIFAVPGTLARGVYIASAYIYVCVCVWSLTSKTRVYRHVIPGDRSHNTRCLFLSSVGHDRCPGCHSFNQISEIVWGKVKVSRPLDDKF